VTVATLPAFWLGGHAHEAALAFQRARESGLNTARALVVGQIASFRDGWVFRSKLAKRVGVCTRTVGRAIRQAKDAGLLNTARAKPNEIPPGLEEQRDDAGNVVKPARRLPCGWSHRWIIGWGKAGETVRALVNQARARRLAKLSSKGLRPVPTRQGRRWTAEELERELERVPPRPPDPEPPDN